MGPRGHQWDSRVWAHDVFEEKTAQEKRTAPLHAGQSFWSQTRMNTGQDSAWMKEYLIKTCFVVFGTK